MPALFLRSSLSIQALLHLLLKISESVTRLESLLSIASPDQEDSVSRANLTDDTSEERYCNCTIHVSVLLIVEPQR